MHGWPVGLALAAALTLSAGTARAIPCAPNAELLFSDTVVVRGVVTKVDLRSEETQRVHYHGATTAVPVTVQLWRATVEVTAVLRGEPQRSVIYDFQTPITGCQGPAVRVGDQLLLSINPRGDTAIEDEATLQRVWQRPLRERHSLTRSSVQDSDKQ